LFGASPTAVGFSLSLHDALPILAAAVCESPFDLMIAAMPITISAFARCSSASGTPISAKTLPLLFVLLALLIFCLRVQFDCRLQSCLDSVDVVHRRFDSLRRLLLERMQDVNHSLELHGINGAIRVTGKVRGNLENVSSAKTLQRFCILRLVTLLRRAKRETNLLFLLRAETWRGHRVTSR